MTDLKIKDHTVGLKITQNSKYVENNHFLTAASVTRRGVQLIVM